MSQDGEDGFHISNNIQSITKIQTNLKYNKSSSGQHKEYIFTFFATEFNNTSGIRILDSSKDTSIFKLGV
jgi:hypothetical protein